jgi:hypothetical protein
MTSRRVEYLGLGITVLLFTLLACSPAAPAGESPHGAGREGWKEFCETEIGCTLYYPEGAHFEQGANKYGIHTIRIQFDLPESEGYQGMVIRSFPLNAERDLDDVLYQLYESGAGDLPFEEWKDRLEEFAVNDMPAWRTYCAVEGGDFSVVIARGHRVYVATPTHSLASVCSDAASVELFFDVLETVTLE